MRKINEKIGEKGRPVGERGERERERGERERARVGRRPRHAYGTPPRSRRAETFEHQRASRKAPILYVSVSLSSAPDQLSRLLLARRPIPFSLYTSGTQTYVGPPAYVRMFRARDRPESLSPARARERAFWTNIFRRGNVRDGPT